MPKVLAIKNSEKIKSEIQDYFSASEDARFVRRLDVIALICNGYALTHVANLFSINPTTVQRWIHRLNTVGFPGLKDEPGRGRRSKLKDGDRLKLKEDIERAPKHFGYEQTRWDGKLLSHHLNEKYHVQLKVRQCQNLFKQLGFSLQRPRKMPVGGDPEKQEAFKKNSK